MERLARTSANRMTRPQIDYNSSRKGRLTIARRFQRRVRRDNEGTRPGGTPEPSLGHRANWAIPWLLFSKDHRPVPTVEERPF